MKTAKTGVSKRGIAHALGLSRTTVARAEKIRQKLLDAGYNNLFSEILLEQGHVTPGEILLKTARAARRAGGESTVLSGLAAKDLKKIANLVRIKAVGARAVFILQDTTGKSFYILAAGSAQVFRRSGYGEEVPLEIIAPGECIGEMGFFSHGKRSASVRAGEESILLEMEYQDLEKAFDLVPKLAINFLRIITQRLRRSNLRFHEMVQKSRQVEASLQNLHRVLDPTEMFSLHMGIEDLITRVILMASKAMNAERASLFLVDEVAGELWSKVAEGEDSREIRLPLDSGITGWVARNEKIVNIRDAYRDKRFNREVDKKTGYRTRSILCGPVINLHGELIGVIEVINKKMGVFTEQDEALFHAFAYQSAISLENFFLSQKIRRNYEKLAILLDIATSVAQNRDLDSLITGIVNKISEALNAERTSLFLLDREKNELWSKVAQGLDTAEIRFPCSTGLAGYVANEGSLVNIHDAYQDPRFNQAVDEQTGYKTRSVLCAPVVNRQGEIIGVTEVINKKEGSFDHDDEELLRAMSAQISVSIENIRLYEHVVGMKNYLERIQSSIANGIISIDRDGIVVTANRAVAELLDCEAGELAGRDARELLGPRNRQIIKDMQYVNANRLPLFDPEVDLVAPGGKTYKVNLNIVPMEGYRDEGEGIVVVIDDITREKRLKGTLTRYMSRDIVDKLLSDPKRQALGGVRSAATVLFSDIRGFTRIAESLTAEETVDLLNECFTLLSDVIFKNRGVLDKFMGDALMAVFGVPYTRSDDAARAVRSAIQMRERIGQFNRRRVQTGREPLMIGIGISTGEVISGNIGSRKRMDFTVIGDDVNISQHLEKINRLYGTEILVSESTFLETEGKFVVRFIDEVLFKGRKKPVRIYEVLGEAGYRLSASQEKFCEALALFRQRKFAGAKRLFAQGAGEDRTCQVFLSRCSFFQKNPPPDDWDGIWVEATPNDG